MKARERGEQVPKVNRFGKATVLTPQQLEDLWYEMDNPYRLATQIAYFTAGRMGEVLQLQAADIRGETIVYRAATTKTKKTREAPIASQLKELLSQVDLPREGYLFPSSGKAGYISRQVLERHVKKAAALIGVEGVSTHSFRRSMATHLHLAGVPLRAIQQITGHATLSALEQYLDIGRIEAIAQHQTVLDRIFAG